MNDPHPAALPRRVVLPFLLLIAATPVIFAALTIPYADSAFPFVSFLRFFSAPVTMIELIVVLLAALRGVDILAPLRAEKLWLRLALLMTIAVAVGTMHEAVHDPFSAYFRTFAWGIHLLFGLSIAGIVHKFWAGRVLEVWHWLMAGLLGFLGVLIGFVASLGGATDYNWMWFGLGVINVRQLGFYSAAGFSIAYGLAILSEGCRARWIWAFVAAAMIALSFWSGTRSSVLSSLTALCASALICREVRTWPAAGLALMTFAVGAVLSIAYIAPETNMGLKRIFTSVAEREGEEIASGRIETWISTMKAISERPLFGYGESQFREIEPTALATLNHPHNMVLQFLYQWGLIGGGAFLALAGLLVWRLADAARQSPRIALPSFLVVANMVAMAQLEGAMYHPYPVMMAVFALAFGLAAAPREDNTA